MLFLGNLRAEEVDNMLMRNYSGVESALAYAKAWSKYAKDILAWVEKRLSVGECLLSVSNELWN